MITRIEKQELGKQIKEKVSQYTSVAVFSQDKVDASFMNNFRKSINQHGLVVSGGNSVIAKALEKTRFEELYKSIKGNSVSVFFAEPLPILNLANKHKKIKFKSGIMEDCSLTQSIFDAFSRINTKEAVMFSVGNTISIILRAFAECLKQIKENDGAKEISLNDLKTLIFELSFKELHAIIIKINGGEMNEKELSEKAAKLYETLENTKIATLMELSNYITEQFGGMVAQSAQDKSESEEKQVQKSFYVDIKSLGTKRMEGIKVLRKIFDGAGLQQIMAMWKEGKLDKEFTTKEDAQSVVDLLKEAGAEAVIV